MKDTEKVLKEELSKHFDGQAQRLTLMSKLLIGIIKLGTIQYSSLSLVINPLVKRGSNFRRIQRFMKEYRFCEHCFIQLVWHLFVGTARYTKVILSIDRTNWKFGQSNINILLIGIAWQGTAIPLIWMLLDKRGNSSCLERTELMDKLLNCLTDSQIKQIRCIVADREFVGKHWIAYLKKHPFPFFIRIRKDARIAKRADLSQAAYRLFQKDRFIALRKPRLVFEHRLFVGGQQISDKEWLIIISNIPVSQAQRYYGQRWGIEVFFGACKSRGFNFESTHVTAPERLHTLIFMIALAFCWALKTGQWLLKKGEQIPIKKLKTRKAKLYSLFRFGLDYLKERLFNFLSIKPLIRVLSCT